MMNVHYFMLRKVVASALICKGWLSATYYLCKMAGSLSLFSWKVEFRCWGTLYHGHFYHSDCVRIERREIWLCCRIGCLSWKHWLPLSAYWSLLIVGLIGRKRRSTLCRMRRSALETDIVLRESWYLVIMMFEVLDQKLFLQSIQYYYWEDNKLYFFHDFKKALSWIIAL